MISLFSTVLLAGTAWQVVRLKAATVDTTADAARCWALAAVAACTAASVALLPWIEISRQIQSAAQYFAAVMLLTPLIAILGARRPGAAAWPWFVVSPLIVVLQWPSFSQLLSEGRAAPIEMPTPTAIGFLCVLLMGAGNYVGTRNTAAVLTFGIGTCLILAPLTAMMDAANPWAFPGGCLLIAIAAVRVRRVYGRSHSADAGGGVQELWCRFRDIYGIVWAKRVMDRVNRFAETESWSVRMTLDGFMQCIQTQSAEQMRSGVDDRGRIAAAAEIPERAVEVLCWVLKRFVDPPFVWRFLPEPPISQTADNGSSAG